jgi:hypothetical protein
MVRPRVDAEFVMPRRTFCMGTVALGHARVEGREL